MSKSYCSYPWFHQFVHTTGHQRICCMDENNITKDDNYFQFNLKKDQILDSWNSKFMKDIRLKMINGESVSNCQKCTTAESSGLESMRATHKKDYYLKSTNEDGSLDILPDQLELHFGNTCNLHCKMCSQNYSHMIGKELLKMGEQDPDFIQWVKKESGVVNNWTGELDIAYDWYKNNKIKKSIFEHVSSNVEGFVVIGGEPTIIKEFYELLEFCQSKNTLRNKDITITTNMTNTSKNLSTWLGEVKSFMIHASIDGIDQRNKYIRFPCNWQSVLNSIEFYKSTMKKYNNGRFSFAPATQLLNIDQIVDLSKFFLSHCENKKDNIAWVSNVKFPIICDYQILPSGYKNKVADKIEEQTKNVSNEIVRNNLLSHVANLRTEEFKAEQKKQYQKMFMRYNDAQDQFRSSISWRNLIPSLETALTKDTD